LKARSVADTKKWVWALTESQLWMKNANMRSSVSVDQHRTFSPTGPPPEYLRRGRASLSDPALERISVALDDVQRALHETMPRTLSFANGKGRSSASFNNTGPKSSSKPPMMSVPRIVTEMYIEASAGSEDDSAGRIERLFYLLQAQMQINQQAVETAVQFIQSNKTSEVSPDFLHLPSLLSHSASLAHSTVNRIRIAHDKREAYWHDRLRRETEQRKRWQDVVQKVVGMPLPSDGARRGSVISRRSIKSEQDTENDEYFDADEFDDVNSSFVETAFGFEPMDVCSNYSSTVAASPSRLTLKQDKAAVAEGFTSLDEIKKASIGYYTTPRKQLPLDPANPKPSLAVWS
jgi:hypothetical protein